MLGYFGEINRKALAILESDQGLTVEAKDDNAWKKAEKASKEGHWLSRMIGIAKAFNMKEELDILLALAKYMKATGNKPQGIDPLIDQSIGTRMVYKLEKLEPTPEQWRMVVWGLPYDALKNGDEDLTKYRTSVASGNEKNNMDDAEDDDQESDKDKSIKSLDTKAGDIFLISTNRKGKFYITVVEPDEHSGFYYFSGKGKPESDKSLSHSNSLLVYGIKQAEKVGKAKFKVMKYKNYEWTKTGFPGIDMQMMSLGNAYQVFYEFAPKSAKDLFNDNEDQNFHRENNELVASFVDWVGSGKNPKDFKAT